MTLHVCLLAHDDTEVLDLAGPLEVFTVASRLALRGDPSAPPPFRTLVASLGAAPVRLRGGLRIDVDADAADPGTVDLLIVPGGEVSAALEDPALIAAIRRLAGQAELVASVCTGALLLARADCIRDQRVTTHWEDLDALRALAPRAQVVGGVGWCDAGDLVTSAGISAGIDMALHLVARLAGDALAEATARQMEYRWRREPDAWS